MTDFKFSYYNMCLNVPRKCYVTTIIYIMMTNIAADIHNEDMHQQGSSLKSKKRKEHEYLEFLNNRKDTSFNIYNPHTALMSASSAANILNDVISNQATLRELNEPGFEYGDTEMVKLKIWPGGIIPYFIDDFSYGKVLRDIIRSFLQAVNTLAGLQFKELPRPPDDDATRFVFFINRRGILNVEDHNVKDFSTIGVQKVTLGYNSMIRYGELAKAVLAIAGVPPQHNAPDRDNYITVVPENILPCKRKHFTILRNDEWLFHDIPYDFSSASHYHFHQHTANGYATIKPKVTVTIPVGEGKGLSHTDILKIRMLYNYISKKASKKDRIPDCVKLFRRGPNWNSTLMKKHSLSKINCVHNSCSSPIIFDIRQKPLKYSGLSNKTGLNEFEQGGFKKSSGEIEKMDVPSLKKTKHQAEANIENRSKKALKAHTVKYHLMKILDDDYETD